MVTKDFVSYETAKLLKEKGFDEPCTNMWLTERKDSNWCLPTKNSEIAEGSKDCMMPTIYDAMKWLREIHKLYINIIWIDTDWYIEIRHDGHNTIVGYFDEYEKGCEKAILLCLNEYVKVEKKPEEPTEHPKEEKVNRDYYEDRRRENNRREPDNTQNYGWIGACCV